MRFAYTTQPIETSKDGQETLDLYIRNSNQMGSSAPELIVSWKRGPKEDWTIANMALTCPVEHHETARRIVSQVSHMIEKLMEKAPPAQQDTVMDDADAFIVALERQHAFQIVWDPRVKKNVKVEILTDAKGTQYIAKVDGEELARCMAEDEDDARSTLVRMVQKLMETDDEKIDLCAKWFKTKKKVEKTVVSGAAPKVHPIEAYLKRGATGHKKLEAKKQKESA